MFECFWNEKTKMGNYKSSAKNSKTAGNFKMTQLTTSNKFHWAMWLNKLKYQKLKC